MRIDRRNFIKLAAMAGAGASFTNCGGSHSIPSSGGLGQVVPFSQSPLLRKFVAPLPRIGAGLPVASADTKTVPGADLFDLAAVQYKQLMHPDLPNPTTLWGYQDQRTAATSYLGPLIVAQRDRPTIVHMTNRLPNKHPLPIDTTLMGSESTMAVNRISVHLHGGFVPWTSDGGPFAWFTPNGKTGATDGSAGVCFLNGISGQAGKAEYYYPNKQSARLMWYHDHAVGITRLNAYAGLASGYVLTDPVLDGLTAGNSPLVPPLKYTIPLIIQDKTFKSTADQWGKAGDLWYPAQYLANQDGPKGRWDVGPVSNGFPVSGTPQQPSCVPEFFADTPVINGAAYPYLEVEPRRYRFLVLNGSQARFYNLNLFFESLLNAKEPDLTKAGPAFIQIGNEGGLLPDPVVLNDPPTLMPYASDGSVDPNGPKNLVLAPAERADLIIDFSECQPGDRLILYNDAPAPYPCGESRNDYFTGNPDASLEGGAPSTVVGKGPNTRTLMQFRVVARQGSADSYNFASTYQALQTQLPKAYADSHLPYGESDLDPEEPGILFKSKTLNEDFDGYGRLVQRIGADEKMYTDSYALNYDDEPTEVVNAGETQVWDIYNTTGDTHPIHFHLVDVQVIGRAKFDATDPANLAFVPTSAFMPPDPNERGWKETVRMNPEEVTRVIMKFALPTVPMNVPASPRFKSKYGPNAAEYVWHCHILEHEEHDMMRPLIVK